MVSRDQTAGLDLSIGPDVWARSRGQSFALDFCLGLVLKSLVSPNIIGSSCSSGCGSCSGGGGGSDGGGSGISAYEELSVR